MISFLIPSHNYGKYLIRCVDSILKNNPKFIKEIVIVNDSSEDNTDEVATKIRKQRKKVKYFKRNFKNLSKTMNFAIKKTEGNVICKIDPDDQIKKNFAEILGKKFFELKADFLYSDFIVRDKSTKKEKIKNQKVYPFLKKLMYPHGSGCLYNKKIWKEVKGYNEKIFYQDDYDFWLKILNKKKFKINYLSEALYIYNIHGSNMSKNKINKNVTKLKILLTNLFKL